MSAPRTGRLLAASLHQAIAELVPARLKFYEHWLRWDGAWSDGPPRAPLSAVLGFLRSEGDCYGPVVSRAGAWAAAWMIDEWPVAGRKLVATLPAPLRVRVALRAGRALVRRTWAESRARVPWRGGSAAVDLFDSIFCEAREPGLAPRCGFYAAAFADILSRFGLAAEVSVRACRAVGASHCELAVAWTRGDARPSMRREPEAAA